MNRRVAITGLGVVSSMGRTPDALWGNLMEGRSGIGYLRTRGPSSKGGRTFIGGEVGEDVLRPFISRGEGLPHLDRAVGMARYAATAALSDAGVTGTVAPERFGVIVGSSKGPFASIAAASRRIGTGGDVSRFTLSDCTHGSIATTLSIDHELRGTSLLISATSASSAHAVGLAFERVASGLEDAVLCGGVDTITDEILLLHRAAGILSENYSDPTTACRPFDRDRDGMVIAEGSAMLVLEDLTRARDRGARIYAEVRGYGSASDAFHPVSMPPSADGITRAMRSALQNAKVPPASVGYINAHGTATKLNDRIETVGIKNVFGSYARAIPISSTKSMTGHLGGAAASLEILICALVLERGVIPPTINLEHPDKDCDLDYVPLEPRQTNPHIAVSNSMGIGGTNVTIVLGRPS